jgi:glycosyltransferase involved in cell wall biosynthesis
MILAAPRENHAATVVEAAEAGVVVSPDNKCDILAAAKTLMESAELRARYAANARSYAERSFDIGDIADRFLNVFSGACL